MNINWIYLQRYEVTEPREKETGYSHTESEQDQEEDQTSLNTPWLQSHITQILILLTNTNLVTKY